MENQPWRILMVDDDEDDYVLMRDLLGEIREWPSTLEWASSFDAGLAKIKSAAHDVYLFDYRLGEKSGLDLLREALAAGCQAPIILLTGQGDYELDKQAMELGAADYLTKGKIDALTLERSIRYAVQRKRVEKALEAARQSQEMILKTAGEGIFGIDSQGLVTFANPVAARLCGWKAEELIGKHAHQTWHHSRADKFPYPVETCPIYIALHDGTTHTMHDEVFWRQDGSSFPVDYVSTPMIKDGKVEGAVVVFQDITERRRLQATLIQSEKMAGIGQFAAGVAHDINNPIAVIWGFSNALLKNLPPDHPNTMPLQSIEREAIRCKNLVKNLLAFSRGSSGAPTLQMENLNEVVEGALVLVSTIARSRKINLVRPPAQELPRVPVDASQIQQVLINLCTNAMDAMPEGGTLTVGLLHQGDHVDLSVQDTGTGIPPEIRDRIFQAFFTTKEVGKGTGLGLSIISKIVQDHLGKIELESEVGKGSTFTIRLPVSRPVPLFKKAA